MTELPIPELPEGAWLALAAGVSLLFVVFAWRGVRHLPIWARIVVRLVLVAVVLAPLAIMSSIGLKSPREAAVREVFPPAVKRNGGSDPAAELERREAERSRAVREELGTRAER